MDANIFNFATKFVIYGIPVLLAITLHEAAHGYAALQKGDDTAKRAGRLSLNPLKHIDLFGTLVLPAILIATQSPFVFGYAKPVPVDFMALRNPRYDMVYVAIAGPLMNFAIAIVSALLFHTLSFFPQEVVPLFQQMLSFSIFINVMLALFNMLPLPPLDGGRVLVGLLPPSIARYVAGLERWGFVILIGAFMFLPIILAPLGIRFNLFQLLLAKPVEWCMSFIASITGILV